MQVDKEPQLTLKTLNFESDLRPQKMEAGEVLRVRIKNTGQFSETFLITGRSRRVHFLPHDSIETRLNAGESTILTFQPQLPSSLFLGIELHYPLRFQVQSASGETKILKGDVHHKGRVSLRLVALIFLLFLPLFYFSGKAKGNNLFNHTNAIKKIRKTTCFQPTIPTIEVSGPENLPEVSPTEMAVIEILPVKPTPTPIPPHAGDILYLTFDDGPSAPWTQQILDVLVKYNAKATFFILGIQAKEYPELIAEELQAGHSIAHHTWAHSSLQGVGLDGFAREISLTNAVLVQDASPCIHLPYAEFDAYTEGYAKQLGIEIIWWDIDTMDWSNPGQENIETAVLSAVSPNDIILLHDGGGNRSQTVAALENILSELSREGYVFKALCSN